MRIRKFRKKLTEGTQLDVMAMMRNAIALHEAVEDGTEGFDEFEDDELADDADMDMDMDMEDDIEGEDLEGDEEMVTITVPKSVAEELLAGTEEAIEGGEDIDSMSDEELISDDDIAEADANIEADEMADDALAEEEEEEEEEDEIAEEDEEAFATQVQSGAPKRTRFTGTYQNQPTVASIIKGAMSSYGDPVTVADGAPKRTRFTGSYQNSSTIKSKYQPGTRAHQNT